MLFRHHHADLPVIFLGEIILIIRPCMRSLRLHFASFRRLYSFCGRIFRRRFSSIRNFRAFSGIHRFRRLPGRFLIYRFCIFCFRIYRFLVYRFCISLFRIFRFCINGLLRRLCRDRLCGFLPSILHQFLHTRSQLLLQIDGIVFSNIHGFHLDVHLLSVRSVFLLQSLFGTLLLQLLRDLQSLSAHHIGIELLLLGWRKRLMKRLQLHGLHHILSFSEPEDQFITFLHTFGRKSHPMVQIRQLIGPFFPIILLLKLLQNGDPFLQSHVLRFIDLILKNISPAVVGRDLHKILIVFYRMNHIAHPDRQIAERIYDHPAGGMTLIRHFKQELRILKSPVHLVYVADRAEHHHALHPRPVNRIRNLCRFHIFFL